MKEIGRMKGENQLDVFNVVTYLDSLSTDSPPRRDRQCKDLFTRLCNNLSLWRSDLSHGEILEALAVSFLVCPER